MEWARILAYTTGTVDQELRLRNEYLAAENRILRAQLNGCLRLSDAERATLGEIGFRLGRKALSEVATVAQPDTIVAWHRRLTARKFEGSRARRVRGRPRIDREVEGLIIRMAEENRSWGYDRIVGTLANLGPDYEVSDQTVGNVLRRHGIPPAPERKRRTTWAEFIRIHLASLAGTDISATEVLMGGLVTCYVLFFIYLESSRIDISRVTNCPNKPWKLPAIRNVRIRGRGTLWYAPHDRDTIYFTSFQATRAPPVRSSSVGAESSMVAPKNECLSKIIFFGDYSSHRITKSHIERNHQGKSTILLMRQIAETHCEEAARCRERRGEPLRSYQQDAA
jgi:putative transposase